MAEPNPQDRLKEITDSIERGIQELFESEKYKQYLRTMSRFAYDGAAVYDQQAHRYLRIYGDYPDQNAMNQVAAEHQQTVVSDAAPVPEVQVVVPAENFRITDDHLGEGGAKTKFRRNMDAILLLKKLESENRQATPEEQEILSQYVGWGGLSDAFDEEKPAWASEVKELREALTPQEYEAARASILRDG